MMIAHQHALDHISIGKAEQIFLRSVDVGDEPLYDLQRRVGARLFQLLTQSFGEIRHLIQISGELFMHPLIELLCPERLFPERCHKLLQILIVQRFDIRLLHVPLLVLFLSPPACAAVR